MLGPSSLCSLHDRPVNPRDEVLRQEETLVGELADQQDGRLAPQNNHLIGVWMPGSFTDQREKSNEKLESKGRVERERQWGSQAIRYYWFLLTVLLE